MRPIAVAAFVVLLPATRVAAEGPRLTIPRVTRPPQIADFLSMNVPDAPVGMRKIEGFLQRFPNDAEPVTERTVVYVGYDDEHLHVVFQCFDREPRRIGAHLVGRDLFPNDEDSVAIHIDTFRDLKHAYGLQINPLGVQTDGIYTEGSGWDLSWDAVWRSEGKLAANGYVVLVSIPFRSLRFPATDVQQCVRRRKLQSREPGSEADRRARRIAARGCADQFRLAGIYEGIVSRPPVTRDGETARRRTGGGRRE